MSLERLQVETVPEYYTIAGNNLALRVNAKAIREIDGAVHAGVAALPRRGLEVGGLLLGEDSPHPSLEGIHEVAIEHRTGPAYDLSAADLESFRSTIASLRQSHGIRVIGHFRSQTLGKPEINQADRTIAGLIESPHPLVLLIEASKKGQNSATLYRRLHGEPLKVLTFSLTAVPGPIAVEAAPQQPSQEALSLAAPAERVASIAALRGFAIRPIPWRRVLEPSVLRRLIAIPARLRPVAIWVMLCALACILAGAYFMARRPLPPQDIGLGAAWSGGMLTVHWNPSSAAASDAASGLLTILDGPDRRELQLSGLQIRSGKLFYVPQSPTVRFRLEVYRDHGRYSGETVNFATGLKPPPQTEALPPAQIATAKNITSQPAAAKPDRQKKADTFAPAAPPQTDSGNSTPAASGSQSIAAAGPADAVPDFGPVTTSAPRPPQLPEPPPLAAPAAPAMKTLPPAIASTMPVKPAAPVAYLGPVVTRKASPVVPASARALIQGSLPVNVDIKVSINAEGRVNVASAVNATTMAQRMLSASAIQAAMLWRFQPARRDGKPVPSETVLTFEFERPAQ